MIKKWVAAMFACEGWAYVVFALHRLCIGILLDPFLHSGRDLSGIRWREDFGKA